MNQLYEKSIKTLELPAVLSMLSEEAVSPAAKEQALMLAPMRDAARIREALAECTDAKKLMGLYGSPSFSGIRDVEGALSRAAMGGSLNARELLSIASLLRTARFVRGYLEDGAKLKTSIDHLFSSLSANRHLEDEITDAIISEDEIADGASGELFAIRREIRNANAKIREILNKIISSPYYSKVLQDSIITMRYDRYVVPVKSEHKGDLPGLTHDVSSSGATLFIEPMQVVEQNNNLRVLAAREQKEIERLLCELSQKAVCHLDGIVGDYRILVRLDLIFAKAKLSYRTDADAPQIAEDGVIDLIGARHPLLNKAAAVPIDIHIGKDFDTLVITGPNTGGKTVSLKTLGLLTLMAECGLHIPASEKSRVSVFENVFADIGDEQSIEQSLSTFSSHMTNIVKILGVASRGSLVLFDELGAGTDPVEGAALAIAIIEYTRSLGARIAATTHYSELKTYALVTDRVENASCEFNVETLKPTFRLLIGIPGRSNAFAISKRLGLDGKIIEKAAEHIEIGNVRMEEVISKLERQRQEMEAKKNEAAALLAEAKNAADKSRGMLKTVEGEKEKLLTHARAQAQSIVNQTRATADEMIEELREMRKKQGAEGFDNMLNEARAAVRGRLNQAEAEAAAGKAERLRLEPTRAIRVGDTVEISGIGTRATVVCLPDKDGNVKLSAGMMNITSRLSDLCLLEDEKPQKKRDRRPVTSDSPVRSAPAPAQIDIRGLTADEAMLELLKFIDNAVLCRMNTVTIIHGKGTGVLRQAVQDEIKKDKRVKSYRPGRFGEGENGVTIVEFA